jgi:hypothetical protein
VSHPYFHAESSTRKWGGRPEDYLAIHQWFDQTKAHIPDARHRLVLHNAFGIFLCEQVFGATLTNSAGRIVPIRLIAEQHVQEDFGGLIPTLQDCLAGTPLQDWMHRLAKPLSRESRGTIPGLVDKKQIPNPEDQ